MLAEKAEVVYQPDKGAVVRKRPKKVRRAKKNNKLGYLILAMLVLFMSLILLSRYANITSIRTEITELERKKEDLIKDRTNLEAKVEGIKSSEKISEEATIKLGMNYPEEGQVAYVSVPIELDDKKTDKNMKKLLNGFTDSLQTFFRR